MNSEEGQEANGEQSGQESKTCNVVKIQNRASDEFKLNNNVETTDKCSSSNDTVIISNGSQLQNTEVSNNYSSSDNGHFSENTNLSPSFLVLNLRSQSANSSESSISNHRSTAFPTNLNLPQGNQSPLSAISNDYHSSAVVPRSSEQNSSRNCNSSESSAGCSAFSNVFAKNSSEDTDMRNNVDYTSDIDKCPPKVSYSSDSSPEADDKLSSKCVLNNIGGSIGSTSQGTCCFLKPNINGSKDGAGPSGLQREFPRTQNDRRDSSSGNEGDLSDEEDHCIYTYKGDDDDIHLDLRQEVNQRLQDKPEGRESGRSSPEMDFLEMDFDPGPSCEQDTGDSDMASINEDIQNIVLDNVEPDPILLNDLSSAKVVLRQEVLQIPQEPQPSTSKVSQQIEEENVDVKASTSKDSTPKQAQSSCLPSTSIGTKLGPEQIADSGECRTTSRSRDLSNLLDCSFLFAPEHHFLNGQGSIKPFITEFELSAADVEALSAQSSASTSLLSPGEIRSPLMALDVPFSLEVLVKGVATRVREPGAALPRYLKSRSLAGATHRDIERGIHLATNGAAVTKFFAFYPERKVSLSHWLHYWITRGAVPIATLNLQHCGEGCNIPDAWHHQMIFGVGPAGIYMTNPLQCFPEQVLWHQLASPSVLLIRRTDILSHWNPSTDLTPLMSFDHRWRKLNVLGQVVNMIRETMGERNQSAVTTGASHVRIPASYQAGITLVIRSDSEAADELSLSEQLPLL
ncbi:uncharacterized protein LOC117169944 [Belonocnema kinseyi]|uniref:uncharacterized protein LOC117169944 n=1 Tax=Belonocnema kinseyi TaxID=2817044 RepID=UPI00143D625D|nr:uncharacterized protein LOC117169944 [Belonocnema kinseyi]